MTYKELDGHLLEELDKIVHSMSSVTWKDLEKFHMVCSCLNTLWHPAMHSRLNGTHGHVMPGDAHQGGSYLHEAMGGGHPHNPAAY